MRRRGGLSTTNYPGIGLKINKTLSTLSRVSNIQSKVLPRNRYPGNKLPAVASAPLGQLTYQQIKQLRSQ